MLLPPHERLAAYHAAVAFTAIAARLRACLPDPHPLGAALSAKAAVIERQIALGSGDPAAERRLGFCQRARRAAVDCVTIVATLDRRGAAERGLVTAAVQQLCPILVWLTRSCLRLRALVDGVADEALGRTERRGFAKTGTCGRSRGCGGGSPA